MLALSSSSQSVTQSSHASSHDLSVPNRKENNLETSTKDTIKSEASKLVKKASQDLTQQDQQKIQQLKNRDLEVKAHEQAHLSAAGIIAVGGARFTYTTGPNGIRYATGGEVSIDTSPIKDDPAATLKKADAIRRAALAPARPSAQDQQVAGNANAMSEQARVDLIKLTQEQETSTKKASTESTSKDDQIDNSDESSETIDPIEQIPLTPLGSLLDISV